MSRVFPSVPTTTGILFFSNEINNHHHKQPTTSAAQQAVVVLRRAGFSSKGISRVLRKYDTENVLDVVCDTPYQLVTDGLCNFLKADQLRPKDKIPPESPERLDAAFKCYIKRKRINVFDFNIFGHVGNLIEILDVPDDTIIEHWYNRGPAYFFPNDSYCCGKRHTKYSIYNPSTFTDIGLEGCYA